MKILIADRKSINDERGLEFYDFFQVNTDSSNRSEVVTSENQVRRDHTDEEVDQDSTKQHGEVEAAGGGGGVPLFIDFLSVGCSSSSS